MRLPSWLGDLVAAEPVLRALAEAYGSDAGRISLAAPAHLFALFDEAFPALRRLSHAGRGGERASLWKGHDAALLLTGSFRSAWTAWRAGIPRRVGWARDGRGSLLTESLRPALERGRVPLGVGQAGRWPRYLPRPFGATAIELAALFGVPVRDPRPRLWPGTRALEQARERRAALGLAPGTRFALVNAGGRPGSAKAYPPEHLGAVARGLRRELGLAVLLVGGPGEESLVRATSAAAAETGVFSALDPVCGLAELVAQAREAALVVSADNGPRHVASAAGARVVQITGPTDPRHTAEHAEGVVLVRDEVPCGPCHRESCPLSGARERACMLGIEPGRVVAAAAGLLGA